MRFKATLLHFAVIAGGILASGLTVAAEPVPLVGFGDSLMAGYQLPQEDALPVRLEKALVAEGAGVKIANAGVSGDTSAAGLARVDWSVPDGTKGVILELGANDALRGIAPEETEKNLEAIIGRLKDRGIAVLLVGMLAPPNMGADYAARFNPIYPKLAERHGLAFYPFILDGVVTRPEMQLEDGMHPNAEGISIMVERMLPVVRDFVKTIRDTPN
ncbi:MAG: arylesterase [Rhizobium sp.]|nr:arylesterase [Rhizobium sp.]